MKTTTVARPQITDSAHDDADLAAQRAVVIELEGALAAARDDVARADGELAAALRALIGAADDE